MITTTYNYSSGSGFIYDASKIGFAGSAAALILNNKTGQTFAPTISSSTYDASILEYVGGALRQIDLRPANATFYAAWSSNLNGNWGNGSTVVTAFNGAAIAGGVLNLTGSSNKYVTLPAAGNANNAQVGTIEFQYKPAYTGGPGLAQFPLSIYNAVSSNNNSIQIIHGSDASLYLQIYDAAGSLQINQSTQSFSPVAGTTYTFLLQYDFTAGATTLLIDGVSVITSAATLTRNTSALGVICGVGLDLASGNANFSISNLAFYSAVVTPGSPVLPADVYAAATANLPLFTYGGSGAVQAYTAFAATDAGSVLFTVNGKYWNGTAWVASNGSYAQASTGTVVNTHLSVLTAADTFQVNALYPAQELTRGSLSAMTVTYTGQAYPTSNPTISPNAPLSMDDLTVFTAVLSASGSDAVTFYLRIGSSNYWWNGTSWVLSNGTYAQSNLASDIQTHAESLPISLGAFVTPYALLHSADGTTTPSLTSLTVTYEYFGPSPTPPITCTVFGYIVDVAENPVAGATVAVSNPTTFFNQDIIVAQGIRRVITDARGYFNIDLVETASLSSPPLMDFSVSYTQANVGTGFTPTTYSWGSAAIPNVPEINIAELTFI